MTIRALALTFLALSTFALSACGLTPVYGTQAANTPVASNLDSIYIDNIPDRSGQRLRNLLTDRLYTSGRPGADAKYRLQVSGLGENIYGLGIAKDATATRSQIKVYANVALLDAAGQNVLFSRDMKAISSFNTLASQYTTLVTEEDARTQTIEDLSQQIVTQLELYFSNPSSFPTQEEREERAAAKARANGHLVDENGKVIDRQTIDWTDSDIPAR